MAELVREQLLAKTRDELPHAITCRVTEWEWPHIRVEIIVERDSQKAIVIGKGGEVLKAVGIAVREELPGGDLPRPPRQGGTPLAEPRRDARPPRLLSLRATRAVARSRSLAAIRVSTIPTRRDADVLGRGRSRFAVCPICACLRSDRPVGPPPDGAAGGGTTPPRAMSTERRMGGSVASSTPRYDAVASRGSSTATTPRSSAVRISRPAPWASRVAARGRSTSEKAPPAGPVPARLQQRVVGTGEGQPVDRHQRQGAARGCPRPARSPGWRTGTRSRRRRTPRAAGPWGDRPAAAAV